MQRLFGRAEAGRGSSRNANYTKLCRILSDADRSERFASADEFRARIEWYLRHRGSLAISTAASLRLEEMRTCVAGAATSKHVHDKLYALFAECRFGFRHALSESADNASARRGLESAIELVASFELANGAPQAAAAALAEHPSPPPTLTAHVKSALEARDAHHEKVRKLERLGADLDPLTGGRARLVLAIFFGVAWCTVPQIGRRLVESNSNYPYEWVYGQSAAALASASILALIAHRSLTRTSVNRKFMSASWSQSWRN